MAVANGAGRGRVDAVLGALTIAVFRLEYRAGRARFVLVNDAARRLTGLPAEAEVERLWELVLPEDLPAARGSFEASLRAGASWVHELRLDRPGDSVRWLHFEAHAAERGSVVLYDGVVADVSSRRREEETAAEARRVSEQLAAEQSFFATVFDTTAALVVVLDTEGRIVRFNKACERATGFTTGEMHGRLLWDLLLAPEEIQDVKGVFGRLRDAGLPVQHENWWLGKQGERRRIAWRNSVIRGDDGRVQYVIGTGIDITEQRELERQLLSAQKLESLGRLVGGIAHDFNNLLSPILGYSDLLLQETSPGAPDHQLVSRISEAACRARDLTAQLLAFGRRQPVHVVVVNLNDTIGRAVALLRSLVKESVHIELQLDAGAGCVMADPARVEQVLMNLVINADQAMPRGGVITIATHGAAPTEVGVAGRELVCMEVRDTGEGMTPEVLERIFEPFFTTREEGTGLGLATVHGIVAQQDGHVRVDSEVGGGTSFRVLLPNAGEQQPSPGEHAPDAGEPERGGAVVLLVEDNELVREFVATVLRRAGYEVLEAEGVEAATDLIVSGRAVDLLLADVVLGDGSGPALHARMAAQGVAPPVLFVSGYPGNLLTLHGIDPGGVHVLAKPFSADALLAKVHEILDRSGR